MKMPMANKETIVCTLIFALLACLMNEANAVSHRRQPYTRASDIVRIAKTKAERGLAEREIRNEANYMPRPKSCPCAFDTLNAFNKEFPRTRNLIGAATLKIETLKHMQNLTNLPVDKLMTDRVWLDAWERTFPCRRTRPPTCNKHSRFRTFDGSCNNVRHPLIGTPFQPVARFLKPEYNDDIDLPRTASLDGRRLPRVRPTSNIVSPNLHGTCFDEEITLLYISWGLFTLFDTIFTPSTSTDHKDRPFTCCGKPDRSECFTIGVADDDPFFNTTCLDFVRASPMLADECRSGRRQQMNQLNSYIDASPIYGLSEKENDNIRVFSRGLLKVNEQNFPQQQRLREEFVTQVAFSRLHNIFSEKLSAINTHWSDERLFHETRKIIGALVQKITYEEYLPILLNQDTRRKFCLTTDCKVYDENENPAPRTGYSVGAGRYGHSQISPSPDFIDLLLLPNGQGTSANLAGQVHTLLKNHSAKIDRKYEDIVRNYLLMDKKGNSYDLFAIDLQRGRDTALPPYNRWREFCGLPKAFTFSTVQGGLVDHTKKNARILKKAYQIPEFIDLLSGGLSETHLPGARLGPTFSCIVAEQFRAFKIADRFFWDRETPVTGFTRSQVRSIRRTTLSKILCETFSRHTIQRNAFFAPNRRNPMLSCDRLPGINLNLWREKKRHY